MASPEASSARKPSSRSRSMGLIRGVTLVVLSGFLVWAAQRWILERAVARSLAVMRSLEQELGSESTDDEAEQGASFPLLPFRAVAPQAEGRVDEDNAVDAESETDATAPGNSTKAAAPAVVPRASVPVVDAFSGPPPLAPLPASSRASKEQVLAWANAQLVPRGRGVPASHGMPAGIEVFDVGGLGLGLVERDRLIAVDGAPVTSRSDVVAAALAARGREQAVIQATLMRRTAEGPQRFTVIIEQPYLEEAAATPEDEGSEELEPVEEE